MNQPEDILNLTDFENLHDYTIYRKKTPSIKRYPSSARKTLNRWYISFVKNNNPMIKYKYWISVNGYLENNSLIQSSPILNTDGPLVILTANTKYYLVGNSDILKNPPHSRFDLSELSKFTKGFPTEWKSIIVQQLIEIFGTCRLKTNIIENDKIYSPFDKVYYEVFNIESINVETRQEEQEEFLNLHKQTNAEFLNNKFTNLHEQDLENSLLDNKLNDSRVSTKDNMLNNSLKINSSYNVNNNINKDSRISENTIKDISNNNLNRVNDIYKSYNNLRKKTSYHESYNKDSKISNKYKNLDEISDNCISDMSSINYNESYKKDNDNYKKDDESYKKDNDNYRRLSQISDNCISDISDNNIQDSCNNINESYNNIKDSSNKDSMTNESYFKNDSSILNSTKISDNHNKSFDKNNLSGTSKVNDSLIGNNSFRSQITKATLDTQKDVKTNNNEFFNDFNKFSNSEEIEIISKSLQNYEQDNLKIDCNIKDTTVPNIFIDENINNIFNTKNDDKTKNEDKTTYSKITENDIISISQKLLEKEGKSFENVMSVINSQKNKPKKQYKKVLPLHLTKKNNLIDSSNTLVKDKSIHLDKDNLHLDKDNVYFDKETSGVDFNKSRTTTKEDVTENYLNSSFNIQENLTDISKLQNDTKEKSFLKEENYLEDSKIIESMLNLGNVIENSSFKPSDTDKVNLSLANRKTKKTKDSVIETKTSSQVDDNSNKTLLEEFMHSQIRRPYSYEEFNKQKTPKKKKTKKEQAISSGIILEQDNLKKQISPQVNDSKQQSELVNETKQHSELVNETKQLFEQDIIEDKNKKINHTEEYWKTIKEKIHFDQLSQLEEEGNETTISQQNTSSLKKKKKGRSSLCMPRKTTTKKKSEDKK